MRIKIATWNMAQGNPKYRKYLVEAWDYFLSLNADFYLFQEARPTVNLLNDKSHLVWNEIGGKRNWGSGIYSKNFVLTDEPIKTKFKGVYTIANTQIASTKLTLISMYGLLYKSRIVMKNLNDMVDELENGLIISALDKNIILGGDLNASLQWDEKQHNDNHKVFFERLERHQLEDCFKILKKPFPLQTLRKVNSDIPWQNDYLFISKRLEGNLLPEDNMVRDDPEFIRLGDHNPVIITLDL